MSKKTALPQAPQIRPAWVEKTSPKGKRYRVCTIPLMLLPLLLESEHLEPKSFFRFAPENGEVLGVRTIGEKDPREL
jgi:hypothetical protein